MSELEIPERAVEAGLMEYGDIGSVRDIVAAGGRIVVAAELRRMAKVFWDQDDLGPARWCVRRANELDPEGTTAQ